MKTQEWIHANPDWQTAGDHEYNVAAPSGRIWHALASNQLPIIVPMTERQQVLSYFEMGLIAAAFHMMGIKSSAGHEYSRRMHTLNGFSVQMRARKYREGMNKLASDLAAGGW